MPAPTSGETYLIYHPNSKTYLSIAGDNTTVLPSATPGNAQLWMAYSNMQTGNSHLITVLRDGRTAGLCYNVGGQINVEAGKGHEWSFPLYSGDTFKISWVPSPTYIAFIPAGGATNTTVSFQSSPGQGSNESWSFQPAKDHRVWNWSIGLGNIIPFFDVSSQTLRNITEKLLENFRNDLKQARPSGMIPTYVTSIPDGTESDSFLALTVGDSFIRISDVQLSGDRTLELTNQKKFELKDTHITGPATQLFKYIAQCIAKAVKGWGVEGTSNDPRYMGMTFPFPVEKKALNQGKLLRWGKGFSATGAVGKDVVKLLQDALNQEDVHIKCNAIINDTTATLLAHAYEWGGCEIGAIFGTGTNAAYYEEAKNVKSVEEMEGQMILNTEWGRFADKALPLTTFDYRIDRESSDPGKQAFEKMVSAKYLGELTRLAILHFIDAEATTFGSGVRPLFNRASSKKLNGNFEIDVAVMREIEAARDTDVPRVVATKFGLPQESVTKEDGNIVKEICRAVARRAARLSACAIAAVLVQMDRAKLGGGTDIGGQVGVEGSLAQNYPNFRNDMRDALRDLIGEAAQKKVLIGNVNNGSDVGAALAAFQGVQEVGR